MKLLWSVMLGVVLGTVFPCTARASIMVTIDPGAVGDTFATRSFDLPELVGLPATNSIFEVEFAFLDKKFVNSSLFFAGGYVLELSVQYDRPLDQTLASMPTTAFVRGYGHVTDENGDRLSYSGSGSFRRGPALPIRFRVGPARPAGSGPSGATTSDAYYGAYFRWAFFLPVGDDPPLIESATLSFLDTRQFWPQPAPLPHQVGQAPTAAVPEPGSVAIWSVLAIVIGGASLWRRRHLCR